MFSCKCLDNIYICMNVYVVYIQEHPDKEQGFTFYQMSHWIAYRKVNNIWYDLNSQSNYLLIDPQPVRITEFYLSAQISKLQDEEFQVYVIRGSLPTLGRYAPKSDDLNGEINGINQLILNHMLI
eukprot:395341_1